MGCRFIYDNLITDAEMVTLSSLRTGLVSDALKDGTGSAVITTSGDYSGTEDKEYIAEIDDVSAGNEIGQATFKWSNGDGTWSATGVATSATNITLENGVAVKWTAGSGDDFELGDRWYFKALVPFGPARMLDMDRDTRCRTAELESPNTITVDLGAAQDVAVFVLYDHNLTSGATIALKGNSADSWGAPAFSEAVSYNADKIIHFLSAMQTYRYWRVEIADAGNGDGYIEIGEMLLGDYFEPDRVFKKDYSRGLTAIRQKNTTPFGRIRSRFYNWQDSFGYEFDMTDDDIAGMRTMMEGIADRDGGTLRPVIWVPFSATPNDAWVVDLAEFQWRPGRTDHNAASLELMEVPRSV